MDIISVVEQQIRLGRKETTRLTEKGLQEIKKFGIEFASEEVKELIEKSYGLF